MERYAIRGDLVWSERIGELKSVKDGFLVIEEGRISDILPSVPSGIHVIDFSSSLVLPGLSDLHVHAPQYAYMGLYMDEELLSWLEKHTFPTEARYADMDFAEKAYSSFANALKHGATTRLSVFGTIHKESTLLLMRKLEEAGLSGFAGKVSMDRNSPDNLREETESGILDEISFIEECSAFSSVHPIVTPRFIPSCTDRMMEALGSIARERDLPVQSHLSENLSEIEWVKQLCPWSGSYTDAYKHFGMIGDAKSIMAHSVWLDDNEIRMIAESNTYIAHAPSSNMNIASGIAPVRRFIDEGVKLGLSTDVAGGSSLSIFRAMTDAVQASKLRWRLVDEELKPLAFPEAFYLGTKGGGSFFGKTGSFEKGYDADIIVVDDSVLDMVLFPELSIEERLEAYAYRAPERAVKAKFAKGERIF